MNPISIYSISSLLHAAFLLFLVMMGVGILMAWRGYHNQIALDHLIIGLIGGIIIFTLYKLFLDYNRRKSNQHIKSLGYRWRI